jgi:tRNA 2-thiouridine synthesizing protein A
MNAAINSRINARWNAGEMGCGMFIVELRRRVARLQTGELLQVTAHGLGAPHEIPAWCRITGHVLVLANHPNYIIERKGD